MSPSQAPVRHSKTASNSTTAAAEPALMKPRRGLFVVLLCVFAAWVGLLLWMYVTTERPIHPGTTRPTAPALALGQALDLSPARPAD